MPDQSNLLALVGHMKVERLAQLAGVAVGELVAAVLGGRPVRRQPAASPVVAVRPEPTRSTSRAAVATPATAELTTPTSEPPLAAMFGHVTHRDLHRVVDRWLLARVLGEEDGNVSHAAERLGISRRTLREHRDRALDPSVDRWAMGQLPTRVPDVPEPPALTPVVDGRGKYRDLRKVVDRWLIGGTLAREHDNVTRAARSLGMSRKDLRARWARVRD